MTDQLFVSATEASARLGVPYARVLDLIRAGEIEAKVNARPYRVVAESLSRYAARPAPGRPYYVYRLYDADGELLYVGVSCSLVTRARSHKAEKFWWPKVDRWRLTGPFAGYDAALAYERAAIRDETPRHNQRSNTRLVITEEMRREDSRLMNQRWRTYREQSA